MIIPVLQRLSRRKGHFCRLFSSHEWLNNYGLLRKEIESPTDTMKLLATFENWLEKSGVSYKDYVSIKYSSDTNDGGRTCHANKDIEASTPVIKIPLHCLINSNKWKHTAIGDIASESGLDVQDGNLFLSLALIQLWSNQKDGSSLFHGPYLDILPRRLAHIPMFWSDSDLLFLKGSPVLTAVETKRQEIVKDFKVLQDMAETKYKLSIDGVIEADPFMQEAITAIKSATPADFAIAEMTVCSRAFEVCGAGKGGRSARCLVPLADMLNTALPHTCDVDFKVLNGDNNEKEFVMHAMQPLKAAQQIFDSYGYKSNHRYLLNYGFSFVDNERHDGKNPNEVEVLIDTSSLDLNVETHPCVAIWGDFTLKIALSVPLGHDHSEAHAKHLMSLFRFLVCNEKDLDFLIASHLRGIVGENREKLTEIGSLLQRLVSTPYISERNEAAAYDLFGFMCRKALDNYPTTAEEDWELIESSIDIEGSSDSKSTTNRVKKFSNHWNALVHVHGEKQIFEYWLERSRKQY